MKRRRKGDEDTYVIQRIKARHDIQQTHRLEILGARGGVDGAGARADVHDDGVLDIGDAKVRALPDYHILDAPELVEDDSASPRLD
jgi:hypothetical protein